MILTKPEQKSKSAREDLRKVSYWPKPKYNKERRQYVYAVSESVGYFHGIATDNDGTLNFPVAVVEKENGEIEFAPAEDILFLDVAETLNPGHP